MRVEVWNGDKSKNLGHGTLLEDVKIHTVMVALPDGSAAMLSDPKNPEVKPPPPTFPDGKPMPQELYRYHEGLTPKILLDTGETVYGCATWWNPIADTEVPS